MNKFEGDLSLGHTQLACNEQGGSPVVTLNYINPDHRLVLPYPNGDWYLVNTAVAAVQPGETIVCSKLIDGLYDYYQGRGLIPSSSHIIQVEPQIDNGVIYGFPATDPLKILSERARLIQDGKDLISTPTFNNEHVFELEKALGLGTLDRPDSIVTNNKARLREAAEKFDYQMLGGDCVCSWSEVEEAIDKFNSLKHGVWLKFPAGSGGDLVRHLKDVNMIGAMEAINDLREAVLRSFTQGKFIAEGHAFWPEGTVVPKGLNLVVESDANNYGRVLINGSTQFITTRNNGTHLLGHFKQMTTDEGEYLGNRPFLPSNDERKIIEKEVKGVAKHSLNDGFYGIQGADWFLIEDDQGSLKNFIVELNSRPTANTPPLIIGNKLRAGHWINTNVYTDRNMETIEDYIATIGEDLALGTIEDGLVIPQSFRTLVTRKEIIPSPNFKALVLGRNEDHCDEIVERLKARSIRFAP